MIEVPVLSHERVDDLLVNGLKIIQNPSAFCFGCDAVEIANFVSGSKKDKAVDLGSGTGIITLLLAGKKGIPCVGVELQSDMAEMANRSIALNGLTNASVINARMQDIAKYMPAGSATIVVSNPPYAKANSGKSADSENVAIARTELAVTLREVVECASYLLSTGGSFYLVHRADRLAEVIAECKAVKLEPKILQVLTPGNKKPHLFLLKAVKDGKTGLDILPQREVDTWV